MSSKEILYADLCEGPSLADFLSVFAGVTYIPPTFHARNKPHELHFLRRVDMLNWSEPGKKLMVVCWIDESSAREAIEVRMEYDIIDKSGLAFFTKRPPNSFLTG